MENKNNTRTGAQAGTGAENIVNRDKDIVLSNTIQVPPKCYLETALQYHANGLRVIPFRNNPNPKNQFPAWAKYREKQTVEDVRKLFANPCDRIAILTGVDGIEAIDIDTKHDPQKTIANEFGQLCKEDADATAALSRCLKVRTKSGGWHIIYRADNIEGNQKLTIREGAKEAVIETRGIGGLLFVAPSTGYILEQGNYTEIPKLSNVERTALISIARLLSHRVEDDEADAGKDFGLHAGKPGDAYNAAKNLLDVAEGYGWREVSRSGNKIHLNRPGAKNQNGVDATILETSRGQRFYPFTTSSIYDAEKCYSAFAMYAKEEHRGDHSAAARELRKQGYGTPQPSVKPLASKNVSDEDENGENDQGLRYHPDLIWEGQKCYKWKITGRGKQPDSEEQLSNFIINPLYLLSDPRNPKRVFEIVNLHGQRALVCALVKELANQDGFKSIVEGKGNFVFYGISRQYSAIKEVWFYQEKTAVEVATLGYLPETNLYAFANGIFDGNTFHPVDNFGIVEVANERYFIPVFSSIYNGDEGAFQRERKFVHDPSSKTTFKQWGKLFCDAFSENENGRIGLVFLCAALFRTCIAGYTNFFPMLFLFGMKGTGKSTFRDAMLSLFGQPQDAVSLGSASSPKGFSRSLSQRRDALMVFEEYKNNIPPQLIEMLKNVFDGIGYERAQTTNDNRTHHTSVLSAVVNAGQELPVKENALHSRMITLEFLKTEFSDEQVAAYNELTDLQKGSGITAATLEILRQRSHIERAFVGSYREMCAMLKEGKAPNDLSNDLAEMDTRLPHNVDERSINNTALLLAVYRILEKHLDFPFTFSELKETLLLKLKMQVEIMNKTNEVCQFWQSVEVLREKGELLEGKDFKIEKREKETWIFIYPATVFSAYEVHQRRTGGHAVDSATLQRYLKRQPGYRRGKGRDEWVIRLGETPGQPTRQKRCLAFELESTLNF